MIHTSLCLVASFVFLPAAHSTEVSEEETAIARLLYGTWKGPACGGDWTFNANGTFEARNYSPGGNRLAGTWGLRLGALPPTLVRTCKTSDGADFVGKKWEVRLTQIDDDELTYQDADEYPDGQTVRYKREATSAAKKLEKH